MEPLLRRSLESGRIHSAYLLSGPGPGPREQALAFVRGLVCTGPGERPCDACAHCRRSAPAVTEGVASEVVIDGAGKKGPLYRHVGDHADLLWLERGPDDTRVRIGQVRAVQAALRMRAHEGGRRAAVIADAEWLNQEAQNALLRLLEEPPPATCLVLVAQSSTGLLATLRSRCQRVAFPAERPNALDGDDAPEERRALVRRLDDVASAGLPELLDWAEEYRGERSAAAERVQDLLETGSGWLHRRVLRAVAEGRRDVRPELDAFRRLAECRKDLAQRNANPQMVAERALLSLRETLS